MFVIFLCIFRILLQNFQTVLIGIPKKFLEKNQDAYENWTVKAKYKPRFENHQKITKKKWQKNKTLNDWSQKVHF